MVGTKLHGETEGVRRNDPAKTYYTAKKQLAAHA